MKPSRLILIGILFGIANFVGTVVASDVVRWIVSLDSPSKQAEWIAILSVLCVIWGCGIAVVSYFFNIQLRKGGTNEIHTSDMEG